MSKRDYDFVVSVLDRWWDGPSNERAHPVFFHELGQDALVAEEEGAVIGFLLGFVSPQPEPYAYVHLVGIHPEYRRRGVGKALYEAFIARAKTRGATRMKVISAPGNDASERFHVAMGFSTQVTADYAGPGRARVIYLRKL